ncbi:MAG: hypothetical protein P0Y66_20915 [Candidatus Kaistia colombiensis]|nr:MAG: hypothetical protein P0Y66_20915 [Kaistia sp.]
MPAILPAPPSTVAVTGHHEPGWLALYVVAINAGLAVLRFAWVWVSLSFSLRERKRGDRSGAPSWRLVAAMSWPGVRGAITLAGVLTLPLVLNDGSPFPARDLAIFLAMGVIVMSLLAASIGLPLLLHGLQRETNTAQRAEEEQARATAAEAAIAEVERVQHELSEGKPDADIYVAAAARIMDRYRARIEAQSRAGEDAALARQVEAIEARLRVAGLKAERMTIYRLLRTRKIGSETARKLVRELDLMEARYEG